MARILLMILSIVVIIGSIGVACVGAYPFALVAIIWIPLLIMTITNKPLW